MPRLLVVIGSLTIALSACRGGAPTAPAPAVSDVAAPAAAAAARPAREVLYLAVDESHVEVRGLVHAREARASLLEEIARNWPGRAVRAAIRVEAGAPTTWVPEAVVLMHLAAGVDAPVIEVAAESGAAGGGTLSLSGRVPDEATASRIAADAAASIASPFVVRVPLVVADVAEESGAGVSVVSADEGAAGAAAALTAALAGGRLVFEPGAAALSPEAGDAAGAAARVLAAHPAVFVDVAAGGDGSGSASLDRELGARRARAVAEALRSRGVERAGVAAPTPAEPHAGVVFTVRTGPATGPDGNRVAPIRAGVYDGVTTE